MHSRDLAARFEAYSDWRRRLSAGISGLHEWLSHQELTDAHADLRVQHLIERLHQDKLVIAFVAEFSRGKSELIDAIFFADFGQRLLPSSAGRTTMCPTELLYDPTRPPSIRLLPIETRAKDGSVAEFKNYADEWVTLALDLSSADKMSQVLSQVSQTKRVPVALARKYGLHDDGGNVLAPLSAAGRLVVLNKIDGLWDELKSGDEIEAEIARQVKNSAQTLAIPPAQVFAVSAQKALLAKVNGDDALLAKSRLPQLEQALSEELI